jgi:REP element-mobilizing transposase RayT
VHELASLWDVARGRKSPAQRALEFPDGWGGQRKGAGTKPNGERAGVSHRRRADLAPRFPVHVTLEVRPELPSLRRGNPHTVLVAVFAAMRARGEECFRLVHYSVQSNHLHLVCEARDRVALSRGIQLLAIRIAKRLNRLWQRAGKLFADRYHDRILRSPNEVRNALAYVLNNAWKHGINLPADEPDPCSSGRWFDGWRGRSRRARDSTPLASARTWLLSVGWLRRGEIELRGNHDSRALEP